MFRPQENQVESGTTKENSSRHRPNKPKQTKLPLSNDEHVELILSGGLMYPRYGVLLGPTAENVLSTIHTKTLFLSVAGIHNGALYNQNLLLVQSERGDAEYRRKPKAPFSGSQ